MIGDLRVFFHVQHLLGIGHLKRALSLARFMAASGFRVDLVSGGSPQPGLDSGRVHFHQLPPMKSADAGFSALVDRDGRPIDAEWQEKRRDLLLDLFAKCDPDILLIEMFPFGRRQLRFELLPLIEAAKAGRRRLIASSVRDILVDKGRADREAEAVERIRRDFDLVLVHGDPALIDFKASFKPASAIADRLRYTGYVVEPGPVERSGPRDRRQREILVSAGGGAVGFPLLQAAIAAKPLSCHRDRSWRLIAGPDMPDGDYARLAERAAGDPGLRLERFRGDFQTLLANAFLSISQAGYNTVMEILLHNTPALLVPFAEGGESEQTQRAAALAARGRLAMIDARDLTPQNVADTLARVPTPDPAFALDIAGAQKSARFLRLAWEVL